MNCPHCQKELPANYSADYCFSCGGGLSADGVNGLELGSRILPPVKFRPLAFFACLLGPAVATMIAAALDGGRDEVVSPFVGLIGGGLGGIACGIMLGRRASARGSFRFLLCAFFSAIMIFCCVMLCFFGCSLGGYQFNFH